MRLFRAKRRPGWTIALALIILTAQLGAQAHSYTHLASPPDSAHHVHPAPCVQCSTFAPLLAAVSSASYAGVAALIDQSDVCSYQAVAVRRAAACRAYRSRAPPPQS